MDRLHLAKEFFSANFETGVISWRANPDPALFSTHGKYAWHMRDRAGREAKLYKGSQQGHMSLKVRHQGKNVTLLAHRIVWALANNDYPKCEIDHANNDPADNRLVNLRLASRKENSTNATRRKEGLKGAYLGKGDKWFSMVWDGERLIQLGRFPSQQAAHEAWLRAKAPLSGNFFNPGYESVFD